MRTLMRGWLPLSIFLVFGVNAAFAYVDCSGQQLACINNCLAYRKGDVSCVNQCTERSLACIQNEFDKPTGSSGSSRNSSDDVDTDDDDAPVYVPPPAVTSQPSMPRAAPPSSQSNGGASRVSYDTRNFAHCYDTFYDPNMYHWLAIRNTCSEPIHVVWVCKSCGERIGSGAVIRPGGKESTGLTADEVARKGGLSFAACGEGYHAVADTSGNRWLAGERYYCKRS